MLCGLQVYLTSDSAGASVKAQSSIVSFNSTGSQQIVAAPLVAPVAGTYYVFVVVYFKGISVGIWSKGTVIVASQTLELSLVNIPEIAWSIYWTVEVYDANDYSKVVRVVEDPILGIMRDLDLTLKYTIPSDFVYPLKMYLYYQDRTYKTLMRVRQSLGPAYSWGNTWYGLDIYDAKFVIPRPGRYVIDATMYPPSFTVTPI